MRGVVGRALEGPWLMTVGRPAVLNMADMVGTGLRVRAVRSMESGKVAPPFRLLGKGLGVLLGPRGSVEPIGRVSSCEMVMRWL